MAKLEEVLCGTLCCGRIINSNKRYIIDPW
jgi:hypothetical protein